MRRPRVSPTCFLLSILLLHPSVSAQTTRNVTLLSHLNLHSSYSNSWPYIHPMAESTWPWEVGLEPRS